MARVEPGTPESDPTTPPAAPFDPLAVGQASGTDFQTEAPVTTEQNEDRLRAAAAKLGMDFENATPDELAFYEVFAGGGLDSLQADADADNPLIPGESAAPDNAPTTPTADAPSPDAGGDARVGPATTPDGGGQVPNAGDQSTTTSQQTPESIPTPGLPAFEIPSTLPPAMVAPDPGAIAAVPEPAPLPQNYVQLADGSVVTVETYQAMVAAQQQQPAPQATPAPVPNAWATTPGEWVDERAQQEFGAVQQQLAQFQAQQAQQQAILDAQLEQQRQNRIQSINLAASETLAGYMAHKGITQEQADNLMDNALRLGLVGNYSQLYPDDPRRAVAASLENMYWQTPELRDLEVSRRVEQQRQANSDIERKRALAGQTVSTPGSVPRTQAPARNASERDAGMVAMIEADPTYVSRQNGAR